MASHFVVEERTSQTWHTYVAHKVMKNVGLETLLLGPKFLRSKHAGGPMPVGSPELDIPYKRMRGCKVEHRVVHGFHIYDITPGNKAVPATGAKKKFLFYAGGGFQTRASGGHWEFVAEVTNRIPNTSAILVSYPLSPKNTADKVYGDIQKVYLELVSEARAKGEKVILAGDSAGGNLSLGLPMSTLTADPNAPHPDVILAISPAVEGTHDNPKILDIEPFDPMLTLAYCQDASGKWRGAWSTKDPRVSPLYADFKTLVDKKIHVVGVIAGYDVLSPDDLLWLEKARSAGVSCDWLVWQKQMHCFPIGFTFGFPESIEGVDWIVKKLLAQV